jgi:hypothetical protein
MSPAPQKKDDRLFVRDGRRSYRRTFSLTEFRIGLGVVAVLAAIAAWLVWKGAHPDPALFAASVGPDSEMPGMGAVVDRGPLPPSLAAPGWSERRLSWFDTSNLYVKINGREDYYKSFGFERLGFVSLVEDADTTRIVDVEFFDQGTAANALGAQAGERSPEQRAQVAASGFVTRSPNALFMTHGRYYVRALGADTTGATGRQLEHVRRVLEQHLQSEPLPWAWALFAGGMGLDPGRIGYMRENAFSFGFANDVYIARLEDDAELFVVAAGSNAASLAKQFESGFADLADESKSAGGVQWQRDRYVSNWSTATAHGKWVLGVKGAPEVERATRALADLKAALAKLPDAVVARAFEAVGAEVEPGGTESAPAGADSVKVLSPASEPAYPEGR